MTLRGIRRLATAGLITAFLVGLDAPSASAFWDDVHYYLTYLAARNMGFTPEQAYRIAAVDVAIDYELFTESSQLPNTTLEILAILQGFQDFTPKQQAPRWKFHAFRDEVRFPGAVGKSPLAAQADEAIAQQENALWRIDKVGKNPGVYLHFIQDRVSHAQFGSYWGHFFNPLDPGPSTKQARDSGLRIGGSVDWLSFYNFASNLDLVQKMAQKLQTFLIEVIPLQKSKELLLLPFQSVLDEMRTYNPRPPDLDVAEFPLSAAYVMTESDPRIGTQRWETIFAEKYREVTGNANPPTLTQDQKTKFKKHKGGPDMKAAERAILRAMIDAGFVEITSRPEPIASLEKVRHSYEIDGEGLPTGIGVDSWFLTSRLEVKVEGLRNDSRTQVDVQIKMPPTMKDEAEYAYGQPQAVGLGSKRVFENIPVGEVAVEASQAGKRIGRIEKVPVTKLWNETILRVVEAEGADDNLEEGWYVLQYELIFEKEGSVPATRIKVQKTWASPKKVRSRMKRDDLLAKGREELAAENAGLGRISDSVKIIAGPLTDLPRDLPPSKEVVIKRP